MSAGTTTPAILKRTSRGRERSRGDLDEATRALMATFERRLRKGFGARLKGLILFGSRARGDHTADSDADLAVVLAGPIDRTFAIKSAIIDDTYDLFLDSGILIQPWPLEVSWLHDPKSAPCPHVVRAVSREGIDLPATVSWRY